MQRKCFLTLFAVLVLVASGTPLSAEADCLVPISVCVNSYVPYQLSPLPDKDWKDASGIKHVHYVPSDLSGGSGPAYFEVILDAWGNKVGAYCWRTTKGLSNNPNATGGGNDSTCEFGMFNPADRGPIVVDLAANRSRHVVESNDTVSSAKKSIGLFDKWASRASNNAPCIWDELMSVAHGRGAGTSGGQRGSKGGTCGTFNAGASAEHIVLPADGK